MKLAAFFFTPAIPLSSDTGVTTYAEWRLRNGLVPILREDRESPPEALLQAIWQHQRLRRDELRTVADGRPVRVLHPGFRSVEGGPDFRGAVVQFGDDPPRSGDVEVDNRNGVVELKPKAPLGAIDISNVHSGIELTLPEEASFQLDAQSTSGQIEVNDFSLNVDNSGRDATARGTVGRGGPNIRLRADRGTIQIRKD